MNRLMRMTYGRSGNRLGRVLVSGRYSESVVDPLWLKALLLVVWLTIPVLISRYGIPTTTTIQQTTIDASQLLARPAAEPPVQVTPPPAEKVPAPVPKAVTPPASREPQPPPAEEIRRPAITRPALPGTGEPATARPSIARQRTRPEAESAAVPTARIRRDPAAVETPGERTAISRTRGVPASAVDSTAPRVVTQRERIQPTGGSAAESPKASGGLRRGVSLTSLQICPGNRQEEEAIKAVLALVGTRQSCSDANGEYHFTGTQRISSFNLIIYPARGRTPSNRCEELENAHRCLTSR